MGSRSNAVDWRLVREAHADLQIVGTQRTNLLLLGAPGATGLVLQRVDLGLREPILTWRPGQPLVPGRVEVESQAGLAGPVHVEDRVAGRHRRTRGSGSSWPVRRP